MSLNNINVHTIWMREESENVYVLHICENVDIFGWPLNAICYLWLTNNNVNCKGPSINVKIFTGVQTIHFRGEGRVYENQTFFCTLLNFCPDFLLFSWGLLALKKCWSILLFCGEGWWEGEGISESVWFVHSLKCCIYGRHLKRYGILEQFDY